MHLFRNMDFLATTTHVSRRIQHMLLKYKIGQHSNGLFAHFISFTYSLKEITVTARARKMLRGGGIQSGNKREVSNFSDRPIRRQSDYQVAEIQPISCVNGRVVSMQTDPDFTSTSYPSCPLIDRPVVKDEQPMEEEK